jgi:hypothetical protein
MLNILRIAWVIGRNLRIGYIRCFNEVKLINYKSDFLRQFEIEYKHQGARIQMIRGHLRSERASAASSLMESLIK